MPICRYTYIIYLIKYNIYYNDIINNTNNNNNNNNNITNGVITINPNGVLIQENDRTL